MAQGTKQAKITKAPASKTLPKQNMTIIAVVAAAAVLAVGVVVYLSMNTAGSTSGVGYAAIPHLNDTNVSDSNLPYGNVRQWRTNDGAFIIGNPNAPITIVEFADFLCPHCQSYKSTVDRVFEELILTGQAKFEYRMYSTQGPDSVFVANFAECAADMVDGGFWQVHDEIYALTSSRRITSQQGDLMAERLGVNYAEVLQCIRSANQIETDQRVGANAGVSATPGIRVRYNDGALQAIPGYERGGAPFSALQGLVQGASALSSQ